VARHRQAEPARLGTLLRGDLDWIVMKCLEKDRTRRYETANGLAMDLQRHLDNEPVVARPASTSYRFQKMVRRNKLAFAAAAAVATVLVVGVVVSTSEAIRATRAEHEQTRERAKAEANEKKAASEAAKSKQVSQLLTEMLSSVGPSVALGRDSTMLRELLDKAAERLHELKGQPLVEAELRTTLGNVYADLAEFTKAAAMHREALAIRRKLHPGEHPDIAASLHGLAYALWNQGQLTEAESLLREALAIRRKLFGNEHPEVANSLHQLGQTLRFEGRLAESEAAQREALGIRRKVLGNEHEAVAHSLNDLESLIVTSPDKLAEAEAMSLEALAIRRKVFGNLHPTVAEALDNLGSVIHRQGKLAEAEAMHREAVAMQRKLLGSENPHLGFFREQPWHRALG